MIILLTTVKDFFLKVLVNCEGFFIECSDTGLVSMSAMMMIQTLLL
jgi:hypothetical protein